jgi:hypothetical protein
MTQLQGTGAIPEPKKGYKLVVSDYYTKRVEELLFEQSEGIGNYWSDIADSANAYNTRDLLPRSKSWQLIPILDSGVWVKDMPLPEAQEGTLLLYEASNDFRQIITLKAHNGVWGRYTKRGNFYTSEFQQPTHWQWISAPDNKAYDSYITIYP